MSFTSRSDLGQRWGKGGAKSDRRGRLRRAWLATLSLGSDVSKAAWRGFYRQAGDSAKGQAKAP